MRYHLSVKNFSCIKSAEIDLSAVTVLIGPQASGKSVISKLIYFCIGTSRELADNVVSNLDLKSFKEYLASQFRSYFPPSAWGSAAFRIHFMFGGYHLEIIRSKAKTLPSENLRIKISPEYEELYSEYSELASEITEDLEASAVNSAKQAIDARNRLVIEFERRFTALLGEGGVEWQYFVPAGRSFFTSQYKATSALTKADSLDPILAEFGRLFSFARVVSQAVV